MLTTTTGDDDAYTYDFGGTSAATPITCGLFGLFFQMWADGIFGNQLLDPDCDPEVENCVFKNRPHMTTAKAMMINTAIQYCFNDPVQCFDSDLTRERQGWGMANVGRLYLLRDRFPVLIDESDVLDLDPGTANPQVVQYEVDVPVNTHALRATLVYADPPGVPFSSVHTVNDLNLRVGLPSSGPVYWGNCGLFESNWSSSECDGPNPPNPNHPSDPEAPVKDVVENVFVASPHHGTWFVRVKATDIVADARPVETPSVDDVDFALDRLHRSRL